MVTRPSPTENAMWASKLSVVFNCAKCRLPHWHNISLDLDAYLVGMNSEYLLLRMIPKDVQLSGLTENLINIRIRDAKDDSLVGVVESVKRPR